MVSSFFPSRYKPPRIHGFPFESSNLFLLQFSKVNFPILLRMHDSMRFRKKIQVRMNVVSMHRWFPETGTVTSILRRHRSVTSIFSETAPIYRPDLLADLYSSLSFFVTAKNRQSFATMQDKRATDDRCVKCLRRVALKCLGKTDEYTR